MKGAKATTDALPLKSASLIGRLGSSAFRPSTTAVSVSLALLYANRHIGPSTMGSEDKAERSNGRPCR